jgi:hypothetical protein
MNLINNEFLIVAGVTVILYALFRFLNRTDKDFDKELDEILNSDKYKVKGQYD